MSDIQQMLLVTQQFPWKVYLVVDAGMISLFAMQAAISVARGDVVDIGQVLARFGVSLVILLLLNAFGLFAGQRMKWIRIDHHDESGPPLVSFFADSSLMGWGSCLGGTQQLYERLRPARRGEPSPSWTPSARGDGVRETFQSGLGTMSDMPRTSTWAVVSLFLGVVSVPVLCCLFPAFVTSPAAIVTGHIARYAIGQSDGKQTGSGLALAGLMLGYGVLVILIGFVILASVGRIEFKIPAR